MSYAIANKILKIIDKIEVGKDIDEKILKITENEIKRRISCYEMMIKNFEKKYKMKLEEFKEKDMVNQLGHSWEVERDFFDWEMAETELIELKKSLLELRK